MSTRKSTREKLAKIKQAIEADIPGAKVHQVGQTVSVSMPDGSTSQVREESVEEVYAPEPAAEQEDPPPSKESRNARSRKWWLLDPWERKR